MPLLSTTIECVVSPLLHKFPTCSLDDSVILFPWQNVVGPLDVIVGADGIGITVTVTVDEAVLSHPFVSVNLTENVPLLSAVIELLVEPSLHKLPLGSLEVKVTLPPEQKVVAPLVVTTGVGGTG